MNGTLLSVTRMLVAATLFVLACGGEPPAAGAARGPNVLLITADDLGWRDLSSYGNRDVETPSIDRLAAQGTRFTRAFVAAPSCSSSRASLTTGQYPHTNGVTGLSHRHPRRMLSPRRTTLADVLADAGYRTGLAGKWHVAPYLPTSWYGYHERMGGLMDMWIRDIAPALEFVQRHRERPFYLEINFMQTHRDDGGAFSFDPDFPVDPAAMSMPVYLNLPDWPEIRGELARYYSQMLGMDAMIGELLALLDELGLAENTLVVFVSDNGPPFPGAKMTLYDRGIATPLLVRWPGRVPAGIERHAMLSLIDVMPTLLEAVGAPVPEDMEGRSFLPILLGEAPDAHREAVFAEMTHHVEYIPTRAVRTERWKYIRNYSDIAIGLDQLNNQEWAHRLCELPDQPWKRPRVAEEFYDLTTDPNEQHNLAGDPAHAEVLEQMRARLDAHMRETADPYLDAPFTRDHDPERYQPSQSSGTAPGESGTEHQAAFMAGFGVR
ncbi:MAG: sulfatase [bacterium]|nr:sulfatase [bacterium]